MSRTIDPHRRLRRYAVALSAVGAVGGLVELATLRHWDNSVQLVPWIALVVLLAADVLVWVKPTGAVLRLSRGLGVLSVVAATFGMVMHVKENYDTAPLDAVFGPQWETFSTISRVWHALNGDVGPSPLLAPGLLAQVGLCLALSTVQHPALRRVTYGPP